MQYACTEGTITAPESSCSPASCTLPKALPSYLTGAGDEHGCLGGASLDSGASCTVKCIGGFHTKSGTAEYSCEKAVLQRPSIICESSGCVLPNAFSAHIIGVGCTAGRTLTDGSSCSLACQEGYEADPGATMVYSCSKGSMSLPNMICSPKSCDLPMTFGNKVIGSGAVPCVPGDTLSDESTCQVECVPGWQRVSGSDTFKCSLGNIIPSTLTCAPRGCSLPSAFDANVMSGEGSDACQRGGELPDSATCKVSCAAGYEGENEGDSATAAESKYFYSCSEGALTKPSLSCTAKTCTLGSLPTHMTGVGAPTPGCTAGLVLSDASSCNLDCEPGYMASANGTMAFSCSLGSLSAPTASCLPASCLLPAPLPSYLKGGDTTNGCTNGGVLSSSSSCSVKCRDSLTAQSGTTTYACNTGQLTKPSLVCEAEGCLVDTFPQHAVGSASQGATACQAGETLTSGQSCDIACASGFEAAASGTTKFSCENGRLSLPTLICVPARCVLPPSFGSHVVGSGDAPCVAGASLDDQAMALVEVMEI